MANANMHAVTELDGQGSDGSVTVAYTNTNEKQIKTQ